MSVSNLDACSNSLPGNIVKSGNSCSPKKLTNKHDPTEPTRNIIRQQYNFMKQIACTAIRRNATSSGYRAIDCRGVEYLSRFFCQFSVSPSSFFGKNCLNNFSHLVFVAFHSRLDKANQSIRACHDSSPILGRE